MATAQILEARRRKVRKGTHSCWECRRRKIRCQYTAPDDTVCIGCRDRGSSCRSQEFPDESPSQQMPEKKVTQRLDRLENMMEQLMTHVMATPNSGAAGSGGGDAARRSRNPSSIATPDSGGPSPMAHCTMDGAMEDAYLRNDAITLERVRHMYRDPAEVVARMCPTVAAKQGYGELDVLDMSTADDTPVAALLGIQDSLSQGNATPNNALSPRSADANGESINSPNSSRNGDGTSTDASSNSNGNDKPGPWVPGTAAAQAAEVTDPITAIWSRHLTLSKLLHSLFPTQQDMDTIAAGAPAQAVVSLFHSQHDIASGRCEPLDKLREIPPMHSHPTVLGRRLMQVALCMQQMGPSYVLQNKLNLSGSLSDVINRIAGIVSHTITSNDELIGSVEGLECLVLLGQQQSNAGQLRKAWLSYRRAMSLAQLMGLDRGNTRALKSCGPLSDAHTRPTPEAMWYRINACDRYVSLLLGLRAGSQDDEPFTEKADSSNSNNKSTDTPLERLEKAHTLYTGRIIERNHSKMSLEQSYAVTQQIDSSLRMAASCSLGASWWEVPTYDPLARPEYMFKEMARSITQVHHHCILILLHLPYMLRGDIKNAQDTEDAQNTQGCMGGLAYSKAACMQSSRAVLQRFVHFHNTAFTCRHVDYASLIAAMTLIIGYLGPRPAATSDPDILDNFDNQLRKDRTMVEQVRARMEHIGRTNKDKLSRESAATIQQLLPVLDLVSRKTEEAASATATAAVTTAPVADTGHGMGQADNAGTVAPVATPATSGPTGSLGGGAMAGTEGFYNNGEAVPLATPTLSAVRLNVPYFGTVNIHANNASPSSGASQYQQPYQQQLPSGFSPMSMPGGYGLFSPSTGMNWNDGMSHGSVATGASHVPSQPHDTADLNAMLVDFDPIPISKDGHGGDGHGGSGGPDGGDSFFGFGGTAAFPDLTGSTDDWVMQGVDTTYWSLLNGGGGSFGGQM